MKESYRTVVVRAFQGEEGITKNGDPFIRVLLYPGGLHYVFRPTEDIYSFLQRARDDLPQPAVRLLIGRRPKEDGPGEWKTILGYEHPGQQVFDGSELLGEKI